jgi:hypothetical protein
MEHFPQICAALGCSGFRLSNLPHRRIPPRGWCCNICCGTTSHLQKEKPETMLTTITIVVGVVAWLTFSAYLIRRVP